VPDTLPIAVVLTALASEYAAVRSRIAGREELVHPDGTRVERGRLPGTDWQVAVGELGEGSRNAAALTLRITDWLRPAALFFVGVAGSLKDDVRIGDVVVGTKVYAIHGGKQTPDGFFVRPEAWPCSHVLLQAARSALRDTPDLRAHFKPVAAGDIVLADARSEVADHLRRHYDDAAAIEMESSGVAHAAHLSRQLDLLVIRGISDRADADKQAADASGTQLLAADRAAEVLVTVLRKQLPNNTDRSADQEGPFRRGTQCEDAFADVSDGTFHGPVPSTGEPAG
jgi:nucleoside phosphorylase